jgi:hypothetical protein
MIDSTARRARAGSRRPLGGVVNRGWFGAWLTSRRASILPLCGGVLQMLI